VASSTTKTGRHDKSDYVFIRVMVVVFNATFNTISVKSWRPVLLVEENGVPGENHWPVASHLQTLSQVNTQVDKWMFMKFAKLASSLLCNKTNKVHVKNKN
jgi:hypothetical protein